MAAQETEKKFFNLSTYLKFFIFQVLLTVQNYEYILVIFFSSDIVRYYFSKYTN